MDYSMQRIDEYKLSDRASSLKERDYKDATDLIVRKGGVAMASVVRRLTPLE